MSGIYIKGMEMPKNCADCPLRLAWCRERIYMETRPPRCPLVEIQPHGRLIDADALLTNKGVGTQIAGWGKMYHETCIEYAPTIIPAEEET